MLTSPFDEYLHKWELTPDGEPIHTHSSRLLPVRYQGTPAMLKIAESSEERAGAALMACWNGEGAAQVFGSDEHAILLERATGSRDLARMAESGRDDEATAILCRAAARLHAHRGDPPPTLVPLEGWFQSLFEAEESLGGVFADAAEIARELFASPRDPSVLHGDIHHGNILDFGERGWLAIDPKGLYGERGYDLANIFCNPSEELATSPAIFSRRLEIVTEHAGLERERALKWIVAYTALSTAWTIEDGGEPDRTLDIGEMARRELE